MRIGKPYATLSACTITIFRYKIGKGESQFVFDHHDIISKGNIRTACRSVHIATTRAKSTISLLHMPLVKANMTQLMII